MNGFVTTQRYRRVYDLPVSLPQTELRRGSQIVVARFQLEIGQRLVLRTLTCNVIGILTPTVTPLLANSAFGLASAGLYQATIDNYPPITSPLAFAAYEEGAATANPFASCVVESPGLYAVVASNNTYNLDLSVAVTGAVKFYL